MSIIRTLHKDDGFEDLFALSKRFFEEYEAHEKDFFRIAELSKEAVSEYFSRTFDSDSERCFVAVDGKRIIGYLTVSIKSRPSFYAIGTYGAISGLMVDPQYRRQGIATDLVDHARDWVSERGVSHVVLETAQTNEKALAFYEKQGFSVLRVQLYARAERQVL